ncbi:MAG: undecaprenyl phosphate translocase family protein [Ignavibacteriales bacterium]
MILIFKGFIIGMGKIIPGVSGAMLAITLGVYDKGIYAISNFFKSIKKNTIFLGLLGIGIILSIVIFSNFIKIALENYYLPTMLLFIGLIAGCIPDVYSTVKGEESIKNIIIMSIPCIVLLYLNTLNWNLNVDDPSFFFLIIIGMIEAITIVIPGLSGTAILMMIGCYELVINSLSIIDIKILIPYGIGIIIGIILLVKIIDYLLSNHKVKTYWAILGFAFTSVLILLLQTMKFNYNIGDIIISLILLLIGYVISRIFSEYKSDN